jgi:hypothetical protein
MYFKISVLEKYRYMFCTVTAIPMRYNKATARREAGRHR